MQRDSSGGVDRRTFLKTGVAGLGGAWLLGSGCAANGYTADGAASGERIGVQLYTVRDRLEKDFAGTMEQVAAVGYREVEFAGYYDRTPEQVRVLLDRLDLTAPSTHVGLDIVRKNLDQTLSAAQIIGHRYVIVPWIEESLRNAEGYRQLAAELNRYGAAARERGIRFGYHNHEFEFLPLTGGQTGMDILLAETDPALVDFELDLFWTVKAGRDPVEVFARHPGRFPLWHVKDMADVRGAQRMVEVGTGGIDFGRIFANAAKSGLRHFFVEHDEPADSLASLRTSYQNLKRILG
jgi:sugar phosphate isomerase/epimerase